VERPLGAKADFLEEVDLALLEGVEEHAASLAEWIQAAVDAHAVQFLETSAVELKDLEAWCNVPDVAERDFRKLAAPLGSDADATAEGHQHVAAVLAAVEALVGVAPDALHGVGAFRLGEDILEGDPQVVVDVVGITVDKIDFSHFAWSWYILTQKLRT